jgi:quinol-cytochrome oxidoreductase complex cytochrome b subunit
MSLVLFLILALTGIPLMLVYRPVPMDAYSSILVLQEEVLFGSFVRSIHHWSANFLIIVALLHMLRVYCTGGFHRERQFNWIIGLCLLLLAVLANFTGYLLPWDQLAYWATTIMTSMLSYVPVAGLWLQRTIRGGTEIGAATLTNFFTLHTTIFPILFVIFMPWHFWRVRKAGGVVLPRRDGEAPSDKPDRANTIPSLVTKELAVALVLLAFVLVFSVLFHAPLEEMANPGMSPNPAKAPWYFMGVQELLLHFHPLFAVFIIPITAVFFLVSIPYMKYGNDPSGVWFISERGRRMAVISATVAFFMTPVLVILDEFFIELPLLMPGLPTEISNGLIPFLLMVGGLTGMLLFLKNRYRASKAEAVQAMFVFLLVVFVVLTITGIWFRGEGMALILPGR